MLCGVGKLSLDTNEHNREPREGSVPVQCRTDKMVPSTRYKWRPVVPVRFAEWAFAVCRFQSRKVFRRYPEATPFDFIAPAKRVQPISTWRDASEPIDTFVGQNSNVPPGRQLPKKGIGRKLQ